MTRRRRTRSLALIGAALLPLGLAAPAHAQTVRDRDERGMRVAPTAPTYALYVSTTAPTVC